MFSGLTNQVSSWMGKAQDEEVPTPPQSATALNPEESVQNLIENVEIADPENPDQKQRYVRLHQNFLISFAPLPHFTNSSDMCMIV